MSRPVRLSLIAIAGLLVLAVIVVIGGIEVLRSDWFYQQVRQRLVAEMEKSTGGKVELKALHFDWHTLTAEVDGLVIHGTEPEGEAPLLRASKVTIGLKLISLAKQQVDVSSVDIVEPQANLLIAADGSTNIPQPKTPPSNKSIDETILDLAVGRFGVQNGVVQIKAAGMPPKTLPWSLRGEKFRAQLSYLAAGPSYSGDISIQPLHASYGSYGPVDAAVELAVKFERDHLQIRQGTVPTASSNVEFSGDLRNLKAPQMTGKYSARVAAQEVGRLLDWRTAQSGVIDSSGDFHFNSADDFVIQGKLQAADLMYRGSGSAFRSCADSCPTSPPIPRKSR